MIHGAARSPRRTKDGENGGPAGSSWEYSSVDTSVSFIIVSHSFAEELGDGQTRRLPDDRWELQQASSVWPNDYEETKHLTEIATLPRIRSNRLEWAGIKI